VGQSGGGCFGHKGKRRGEIPVRRGRKRGGGPLVHGRGKADLRRKNFSPMQGRKKKREKGDIYCEAGDEKRRPGLNAEEEWAFQKRGSESR